MTPEQIKKYNAYAKALIEKAKEYINDGDVEVDFESLFDRAVELHTERNLDSDVDRFIFKVVAYAVSLHGLKKWFDVNKSIANEAISSGDFDLAGLFELFDKRLAEKGIKVLKRKRNG